VGGQQEYKNKSGPLCIKPLLDSQMGSDKLIQENAEVIPKDGDKCSQSARALGRNWVKINVPTVVRKGNGRINVPSESGTPKRSPRLEAEARLSNKSISPPTGEPAPGRKTLSVWQAWKAMRRIGQTGLHSTRPPGAYGPNENKGSSH
jgi:hypothetical protein